MLVAFGLHAEPGDPVDDVKASDPRGGHGADVLGDGRARRRRVKQERATEHQGVFERHQTRLGDVAGGDSLEAAALLDLEQATADEVLEDHAVSHGGDLEQAAVRAMQSLEDGVLLLGQGHGDRRQAVSRQLAFEDVPLEERRRARLVQIIVLEHLAGTLDVFLARDDDLVEIGGAAEALREVVDGLGEIARRRHDRPSLIVSTKRRNR